MNVFEAVKGKVTTRQAAELYGIRVNCHGMAVCPFHNDKNPSMKRICVSIALPVRLTGTQLILFPGCLDCPARKPL